MEKKPFVKWRVDCGARGVHETLARSAAEAVSRIKWRFRQVGVFVETAYWGEAEMVKDERP